MGSSAPWSSSVVHRKHKGLIFALAACTLVAVSLTFFHHRPASRELLSFPDRTEFSNTVGDHQDDLADIYNDTVGFQKVFAINLPERTDKRDTMRLQARLTNFSLEISDGVLGKDVSQKTLPPKFDQNNGTIGSWRAHLNIFDRMMKDNIQSALVFEDDADWDIGLKAQLVELAKGSRWILGTGDSKPYSPYGDGWDILWLGHCESVPRENDDRRWVIPHDPTVPPVGSRWHFRQPNMKHWEEGPDADPQTRIIYQQTWGYCTSGYAVSLRGAERILYWASMEPFNMYFDGRTGQLCTGEKFHDFTCIAPFPRLVGRTTPAGSSLRGSDINPSDDGTYDEEPKSENIMFSVRMNMIRLLNGNTTFKSYFPNPSGDELTLEQITAAKGHPEHIDLDVEYSKKEDSDEES